MKTPTKVTFHTKLFLFLITTILIHPTCKSQMSEEIILTEAGLNGGFEISQSNLPVNWILYTPKTVPQGAFRMGMDTLDRVEGKQSLMFNVVECSTKGGWYSPGFCKEWNTESGATYRISFSIKNSGSNVVVKVHSVSPKRSGVLESHTLVDTNNQWKKVSYDYAVSSDFSRLRLEVNILSKGIVKVDDVKVELLKRKY